ncbi:MAG TPA: nucleotide-binding protein [Terriglobales bacterium]|nr:nucleotide-binding protein [Terriglobales bacterium]
MAKRKAVRPKLFIGSSAKSVKLAYAIHENLDDDAEVTVWKQGIFKLTKSALENLVGALDKFDFAVFVFAPDDTVKLGKRTYSAVRDNVVFELGLFMGKLGRDRVFVVTPKRSNLRIPTDLAGITLGRFDPYRNDKNLEAAFGPFCSKVLTSIRDRGPRAPSRVLPSRNRSKTRLTIFDAVADFSIDQNPKGAWSYGYSKTIGGPFLLHTTRVPDVFGGKVDRWSSPAVEPNIAVMRNKSDSTIPGDPPTYEIPPDVIHMHPGEGGIFDIVRWTCPQSGQYSIQGAFRGLDGGAAADVDVHVTRNSTAELFSEVLLGPSAPEKRFALNCSLGRNETLDFMVGVGPSGSHGSDSTGFRVRITLTAGGRT